MDSGVFESNAIAYYGNLQWLWEWEGLEMVRRRGRVGELEWTERRIFQAPGLVLA